MYYLLLSIHSLFRWLVLLSLLFAIARALQGYRQQRNFTKTDNAARHWTATLAHLQLMLGFGLYVISPVVQRAALEAGNLFHNEHLFFRIVHLTLMLMAIVLLTVGSARAKRKNSDREKFKTMLWWFSIALLIILIAIPWPFSPFANRPYLRTFY